MATTETIRPNVEHAPVRRRRPWLTDRRMAWLFISPTVLILLAISIFPLIWSLGLSFTNYIATGNVDPITGAKVPARFVGLRNYHNLLTNNDLTYDSIWHQFTVSASMVICSVTIEFLLGFGLALLLVRKFPGRGLILTLMLTPMMLGLIVASTLVGQLMVRIRYYRFLGTAGIVIMLVGLWLLSQVTVTTSRLEVVRDIVLVGAGLGSTFPLYLTAVQSALPRNFLGVASSQVQFWRQIGGTIGTAVLGSVLAQRLPVHIGGQVASLHLPAQAARLVTSGGTNPQTLFDPAQIAARRAQASALGQQGAAIFDQVLHAIRAGLAATLHEIFLYAAAVLILALIASVFLDDVPLRGRQRAGEEEAPVAAA